MRRIGDDLKMSDRDGQMGGKYAKSGKKKKKYTRGKGKMANMIMSEVRGQDVKGSCNRKGLSKHEREDQRSEKKESRKGISIRKSKGK